jgi:hypothetical protein
MHISIFSHFSYTRCEKFPCWRISILILIIGLLQHLEDCGSPPLAARSRTLERPNSLRTSDRKSMMAYLGLPLDIFGKARSGEQLFGKKEPDERDSFRMHSSSLISHCNNST